MRLYAPHSDLDLSQHALCQSCVIIDSRHATTASAQNRELDVMQEHYMCTACLFEALPQLLNGELQAMQKEPMK